MKKVITAIALATAMGTASAQGMWQPPSILTSPGTMGGSSSSRSLFDDIDRHQQEQQQRQQQYRIEDLESRIVDLERRNRYLQEDINRYNSKQMTPIRPYPF